MLSSTDLSDQQPLSQKLATRRCMQTLWRICNNWSTKMKTMHKATLMKKPKTTPSSKTLTLKCSGQNKAVYTRCFIPKTTKEKHIMVSSMPKSTNSSWIHSRSRPSSQLNQMSQCLFVPIHLPAKLQLPNTPSRLP